MLKFVLHPEGPLWIRHMQRASLRTLDIGSCHAGCDLLNIEDHAGTRLLLSAVENHPKNESGLNWVGYNHMILSGWMGLIYISQDLNDPGVSGKNYWETSSYVPVAYLCYWPACRTCLCKINQFATFYSWQRNTITKSVLILNCEGGHCLPEVCVVLG